MFLVRNLVIDRSLQVFMTKVIMIIQNGLHNIYVLSGNGDKIIIKISFHCVPVFEKREFLTKKFPFVNVRVKTIFFYGFEKNC